MDYAFETLEIEKHRLLRALREMRSMPATGDDLPVDRIKEHTEMIAELDRAIAALKYATEEIERLRKNDPDKWRELIDRLGASYHPKTYPIVSGAEP